MQQPPPRREPASLTAWMIVLIGFGTLAVLFSARGALSLAMPAWSQEFGWSHLTISAIAAVAMLVMAVVAPFAGSTVDRHGQRLPLVAGLGTIGAGMFLVVLAGHGKGAWLLPIGFSIVAAIGFGFIAQHVVAAAIAQHFQSHRGVATGIGLPDRPRGSSC